MDRRQLLRSAALAPFVALLDACAGTTPGPIPPIPVNVSVDLPQPVKDFLTQLIAIINDVQGSGAVTATQGLIEQLKAYVAQIEQNPPALKTVVASAATIVTDVSAFLPPPWNLAASAAAGIARAWATGAMGARLGAARPTMTSAEATYVLTHTPAEGQAFLAARGIVR